MLVGILTAGARFAKLRFAKVYPALLCLHSGRGTTPVRAVLYSPRFVTMETGRS